MSFKKNINIMVKYDMDQYVKEWLRLKTFKDYPKSASQFAIVLAKLGYIYIGDGTNEKCCCVFCGCVMEFGKPNEDVTRVHRKLYPNCPMVTNRKCGNIPIDSIMPEEFITEIIGKNKYSTDHGEVIPWSNNLCASIKKSDATNQSKLQENVYSQFVKVKEKPTDMATYIQRLETFTGWPNSSFILPSTLAEAGFYYEGYNDCVKCYHCGLGLRHWRADDDVWVLHSTGSTRCGFLRQCLGQPFIDAAVELKSRSENKVTFKMVIDQLGTIASIFHLDTFDNSLKTDPAVRVMISSGYDENMILKEARELQSQGKPIDVPSLLQRITNQGRELHATKELIQENQMLRLRTLCKKCLRKDVAIAFVPCKHLHYCLECSSTMSQCLSCNKDIRATLRVYITS